MLPDTIINESLGFLVFGLQHSYKRIVAGGNSTWEVSAILVRKVSDDPEWWRRVGVGQISVHQGLWDYVMGLEDFGKKRKFVLI